MMTRLAASLMLLACFSQPLSAKDIDDKAKASPEAGVCKPVCIAARQECRASAEQATATDTSPVLSMRQNTNPNAVASKEIRPQSQQLRPTEEQAFRARRSERLHGCEVQYRSCLRTCE